MNELIQAQSHGKKIRWQLLAETSAVVLAAYVSSAGVAKAEDVHRPTVWIELGGQFAHQAADENNFDPPFLTASPFQAGDFEKAPSGDSDANAKISFQPHGSDWIFSASVRYGKSSRPKSLFDQTHELRTPFAFGQVFYAFQNARSDNRESHTILDFQAGKDVGLGVFGKNGTSTFNRGLRFAHFDARNQSQISSQPTHCSAQCPYNQFHASFAAKRSFTGVGPSLSWDASDMLSGSAEDGGLSFDWGLNGALLFGRQKVAQHHKTSKDHWNVVGWLDVVKTNEYTHSYAPAERQRYVIAPNLGGSIAISYRWPVARISFGYRADMFFNVIDGGIDTSKSENRGFFGPYASISIGIGASDN